MSDSEKEALVENTTSTSAEDLSNEQEVIHDELRFIENIAQFFNQESMSDIILNVGNRKFFAHSFVLAKSSEVFRTMLYEKRWTNAKASDNKPFQSRKDENGKVTAPGQENEQRAIDTTNDLDSSFNVNSNAVLSVSWTEVNDTNTQTSPDRHNRMVNIVETSECEAVFDRFLQYLYSARIQISPDTAVGILCLADKYNVIELKDIAVNYMVRNARSPRVQNALSWYEWAKMLSLPNLLHQCFKTVVWNVEEIIRNHPETWLTLDVDFLCDILGSSEIVVSSEYLLFEALHKWLLHESRLNKLAVNAAKLLPKVRFAQMLVSQLYSIEQCDLWNCSATRDFMHSLVARAYRFRALCPSQRDLGLSFAESFFAPRDYVQLAVDTIRISNTLRYGLQVDVKMYVGPCPQPQENWTGDWKITCRKQHLEKANTDRWTFSIYCHDSAMLDNEARFQVTVLVYNADQKITQVEASPPYNISRGVHQTMQVELEEADLARELTILIKPLPLF